MGFITSEPMPDSQRMGARLSTDRGDGHELGTQTLDGAIDRGFFEVGFGDGAASQAMLQGFVKYTTITTPVSTAMPKSAM